MFNALQKALHFPNRQKQAANYDKLLIANNTVKKLS